MATSQVKTRTNQKYLKMSRKQLDNFLEQEGRFKLGASITRFAVSGEESDEEKPIASGRRLSKTRLDSTRNEPRNGRNKGNGNSTRC